MPVVPASSSRPCRLRIAAAIALALAVAACKAELYGNLDERQANEIVAALQHHGIAASRGADKEGRITVSVDGRDFARAFDILRNNGLPRRAHATLGEVFKPEGLVASPLQERARMTYALSEELSRSVGEIDGVLSARVHIVLPEYAPLQHASTPASASVLIRHRAGVPMGEYVPQIKTLVANGIAGLTYDGVSVVLVPAPERPDTLAQAAPVSFLGMWLRPDSLGWARLLMGLAALTIAVLAAGLGYAVWRSRSSVYALGTTRREAERPPEAGQGAVLPREAA
ncbi:type III secretion inner membrane ring lipoprotein SctJ [Chelatococcus daeguensis]|uniref:type III secretion system inner membrane ring lipoprotein SctJ n=1 Tax=Chelatococcus daeguensis TaxID=444444 RepID=UPI0007AC0B0E|nr:type III secretion inner membrane ring lipoprotein SctJ [Chelatococcus daeguensis]KZE28260.1 type III secretion protein [Chelatococcus daeguensis]MBM3084378.1 type III secretion inner membrane ring lipoprotein SctJ [Chelatococcus daeguensis]